MSQPPIAKTVIIITKTTPYCGGANPPEQILANARKQKIPFGEKFYIIKGSRNSSNRKLLATLLFDSTGKCFVQLQPGCYSVISEFGVKMPAADTSLYDMECLKKTWATPLFVFKVIKSKNGIFSHNIAESCPQNQPCYIGKIELPM